MLVVSGLRESIYQVEDEEGRTHLLIHIAIEEHIEHRWSGPYLASA